MSSRRNPTDFWAAVGYSGSNTVRFTGDEGEKVYRRSVYTFWKRTSPPPQMSTFDAPSRESCTARRERTNTPLQALLLMNETQYVEAANHLAKRTLEAPGHPRFRSSVDLAVRDRHGSSAAGDHELNEMVTLLDDMTNYYTEQPDLATKLVGTSDANRCGMDDSCQHHFEPRRSRVEVAAFRRVSCSATVHDR